MDTPIQLQLFPTEEDSLLYGRSPTWQSLSDTGKAVVRSYLVTLSQTGRLPTQTQLAKTSGLSRHAVSLQLGDSASLAWRAITELLASCRDDLAARSSVAIPYIAVLILQQFARGPGRMPRETSTLTRVELDVLKAAGAMGGIPANLMMDTPVVQVAAGVTPGGQPVAAVSVGSTGGATLADLVSKLRASQLGQGLPPLSVEAGQSAVACEKGAAAVEAGPDVVGDAESGVSDDVPDVVPEVRSPAADGGQKVAGGKGASAGVDAEPPAAGDLTSGAVPKTATGLELGVDHG